MRAQDQRVKPPLPVNKTQVVTSSPLSLSYCTCCKHQPVQITLQQANELSSGYKPAQVVQHSHVCIHIIEVVGIGWVVLLCPVDRQWTVQVEDMLLWF